MEEKRIGVYICWCGTNIAKMVDVEAIAEGMKELPNVVLSKNYKYMCSDPGQELIIKDIKENKLNRVVVAACSPRIHELTFRKALENAGLNPYLFQMANIREQVSWVHTDPVKATEKARSLIKAAIQRVSYHEALDSKTVNINPATLIIGGGISGISAALEIANSGKKVFLIEKTDTLGGHAANIDLSFPYMMSVHEMITQKIKEVNNHSNITLFLNNEISDISGYVGNFETIITQNGNEIPLKFGNIIVATGLKTYDPSGINQYGYQQFSDVITSSEFESMLKKGEILTSKSTEPKNIAIIHCVGSRNKEYHEYCSRICCSNAIKYANQLKTALPEANIFNIYSDIRTFGKGCEEMYTETSRDRVLFLKYDQQYDLPTITSAEGSGNDNMMINLNEKLSGENVDIEVDLVILMTSMEAREDAKKISHTVGISMCGNEFFIEKHPKLDPVATTTDGVYIVGSCQGPKDIIDSITQAKAATSRILASIAYGTVEVETTTAFVNEELCCGCQTCIKVCPYIAVSFDNEKKTSVVNDILCKGCGTCGSSCPTGAISSRHFTDEQILHQIEGIMRL
ncbi:CoB--CoM heterodisulfide reductase iron-sulfur subunit A family protein [Bacteroidota bacterium]